MTLYMVVSADTYELPVALGTFKQIVDWGIPKSSLTYLARTGKKYQGKYKVERIKIKEFSLEC